MTMLERMATAIADRDGVRFKGRSLYDGNPTLYLDLARAALEAIREPDDATVLAGMKDCPMTVRLYVRPTFTAMIDAILSDTPA